MPGAGCGSDRPDDFVYEVVIGHATTTEIAHVAHEDHPGETVQPRLVGSLLAPQVRPARRLHHSTGSKAHFLKVFGVKRRQRFRQPGFVQTARVTDPNVAAIPQLASVASRGWIDRTVT
jgi:hypothetical protein